MAITNNGTEVNLQANKIPTGYSLPSVTTFTDYEYKNELILSVDKSTVENATATTTLANILANGTVGITKQIDDILAADYLASATVDAYASLNSIDNNINAGIISDFYNADAVTYECSVTLYVKTA
ncbi:MAG: hypothetical protein KUG64_10470 [Cycloclasticus sp.]|nr:hypothetical protein [Cycloclasticus sp.]